MGVYRSDSLEIRYHFLSRKWARKKIAEDRTRIALRMARNRRIGELTRKRNNRLTSSVERFGGSTGFGRRRRDDFSSQRSEAHHERREDSRELKALFSGQSYQRTPFRSDAINASADQKTTTTSAGVTTKTVWSPRAIARAVERSTKNALLRMGFLVRQSSAASISPRKKVSTAGQPPSTHIGTLPRSILYAYDPGSRTCVVGPIRRAGPSGGRAPAALEYGGPSTMLRVVDGKKKRVNIRIAPRPFMRPALNRNLPQFLRLFRNSFGR